MPSLFKPTIISYHLPDGRKVPKGTPGAHKRKRKAKNWYGQYRDAEGRPRRVPLCPDKAAAKELLAKLVTDAAQGRHGIGNPFETHQRLPLTDHLRDYRAYLEAKDDCRDYVSQTVAMVSAILDTCRFSFLADLSANRVMEYLADRRKAGTSIGTSNHYLRAIKGLSAWLVKDRRTGQDVMKHLSCISTETDRRRKRRALPDAEFEALLEATKRGKPFRDLDGYSRYVLYLVAGTTGLRASELASVTAASFDLDGGQPTLTVEAAYSKRRRRDVLPLHPGVVPILRDYLQGKARDAVAWPGTWSERSAKMLRLDLAEAGIPYRDESGRVFDFHSLRGQFISSLARNGVHPRTAQLLARHSDINLTMGTYTHLGLVDLGSAVESLPLPGQAKLAKATG